MKDLQDIASDAETVLRQVPPGVILVAAAKSRTVAEVRAALDGGVRHVGHNYVQEAEQMLAAFGQSRGGARWHLIGHLQRNKARQAAGLFDTVETVDSWELARELDRRVAPGARLAVLIEVNSGRETNKAGVMPEDVEALARRIAGLEHLRLEGLMTLGPRFGEGEDARPFFRATRQAFDRLAALDLAGVTMRYLSMGMSNSYEVAIAEGANVIRLGERLFGPRTAVAG